MNLVLGDCLEVLRGMDADSVDAVVTDPPYGLSFMGKRWDYDVPTTEVWAECLRVLKPGGHLLAFAGTRTQHRMAVRIEDAGFEIRDMIAWVYGSGFPKSLDVSKAIDKCNGETGRLLKFTEWMRTTGLAARQINKITETNMGGHYLTAASQPAIPTPALWALLRPHCGDVPVWVDKLVQRIEAEREVLGQHVSTAPGCNMRVGMTGCDYDGVGSITAPATDAARQWDGWGTALKPALEPITVARKPLVGTVAANVLRHGTGAINVDGCRVVADDGRPLIESRSDASLHAFGNGLNGSRYAGTTTQGRWPANLIHDGSDEVVGLFPQAGGGFGVRGGRTGATVGDFGMGATMETVGYGDIGSAARFFYCPKASKADRDEGCEGPEVTLRNHHPTVKPTALMRYLCRLVTPPNGIVLDPFMGSGSTGKAAILEGFGFVGIEREPEYLEIARRRIEAVMP